MKCECGTAVKLGGFLSKNIVVSDDRSSFPDRRMPCFGLIRRCPACEINIQQICLWSRFIEFFFREQRRGLDIRRKFLCAFLLERIYRRNLDSIFRII